MVDVLSMSWSLELLSIMETVYDNHFLGEGNNGALKLQLLTPSRFLLHLSLKLHVNVNI